jgi:electron transfer flavoprotein alpha/beta subunit
MGSTGMELLKWPVPGNVRDIDIEDRRLVIRTR